MRMTLLLARLVLCTWSGVSRAQTVNPIPETATFVSEDQSYAVVKADKDFCRMAGADGAAKAFDFYLAPDALEAFADKESPALKAEIIERMRKLDAKGLVLSWTPFKAEVASSQDFGYSFGQWELRKKDGGKLLGYGYYSTVWKKVNGEWKAFFDMGNESPLEGK